MTVKISVAISMDGYIDDSSSERLVLSCCEDWEQVREIRKNFDAILVGAQTIRNDNPALTIQNREGQSIAKVAVSGTASLDPKSRFFTEGQGDKIVITSRSAPQINIERLSKVAKVLTTDTDCIEPENIIELLSKEGVGSLLIEGGSRILTMFLSSGKVDYLRLAVAPFFVGESDAVRFVGASKFPHNKSRRAHLISTEKVGDMAVMEYALRLSSEDCRIMEMALHEASKCPVSDEAYSVGAVIATTEGDLFTGYSRETAHNNHAEEEALLKARHSGVSLAGATIYSTMEPCTTRKSKHASCSSLIIGSGIKKVIFALYEPANFVQCEGYKMLSEAGIEVVVASHLANRALDVNAHILSKSKK